MCKNNNNKKRKFKLRIPLNKTLLQSIVIRSKCLIDITYYYDYDYYIVYAIHITLCVYVLNIKQNQKLLKTETAEHSNYTKNIFVLYIKLIFIF